MPKRQRCAGAGTAEGEGPAVPSRCTRSPRRSRRAWRGADRSPQASCPHRTASPIALRCTGCVRQRSVNARYVAALRLCVMRTACPPVAQAVGCLQAVACCTAHGACCTLRAVPHRLLFASASAAPQSHARSSSQRSLSSNAASSTALAHPADAPTRAIHTV
jgi:hypothetical protein